MKPAPLLLTLALSLGGCSDHGAKRTAAAPDRDERTAASSPARLDDAKSVAAPDGAWDPANTYVVLVGALTFQSSSMTSFSPKHRKDDELAKLLLSRGVPKDHLVELLDEQATAKSVFEALEAMAKAAPKGATLLFYYAGHGGNGDAGEISFVAYDDDGTSAKSISMKRVEQTIARAFAGGTVLLFADCCYSGGLLEVARNLGKKPGVRAAAVTSAAASNLSSGNWTFSQSLIDALDGDAIGDRDGDGAITLGELGEEVRAAMKYRELQRMGAEVGAVGDGFVLATDNPHRPAQRGIGAEYLSAKRGDDYEVARVVGARGDELTVEFYDYSDKSRATVRRADTKPLVFEGYPVGSKVSVEWERKWWDAEVLARDDDFHLITYAGFNHSWDEWVLSNRVATRGKR
ncbi:MAG: caspase family protein [Polyangiaceae bacterium]